MYLAHGEEIQQPTRIVVHSMGEFIDTPNRDYFAPNYLDKCGYSAHVLVMSSGIAIRCREDLQGAYHAKGFNRHSLGIEFLIPGLHTYATFLEALKTFVPSAEQWSTGVGVVREWVRVHKIQADEIYKHSDISPGRKFDPGENFPWVNFIGDVMQCQT